MNTTIQPFQIDFGSQLTLLPGDPFYEHLKKTNPKKLARLVKEEEERYLTTHTPGYNQEIAQQIEDMQAKREQRKKKSPDYLLLGLEQAKGKILKKDVRNAYRRQARKLHPDVGGTDEAFQELHAAYRRVLASVPKE